MTVISASIRKAIRLKMQEILIAAETNAGTKVATNRIRSVDEKSLPQLSIRTLRETATPLNRTPVSFARTLVVAVVCVARADDQVDNTLDDLAAQVEAVILGSDVNTVYKDVNGEIFVNRIELADTDMTLDLGNSEIGACSVHFNVEYDSFYNADLPDLEGFNIKIKVDGALDINSETDIDTEPT